MEECVVFAADPVAERRQVTDVVDDGVAHGRENHQCRSCDNDEQHQQPGECHVELTQPLDALVEAGDHRGERYADDDDDEHDLDEGVCRRVEQVVQAAGYLLRTERQGYREAE